jgi:hypothetical protein
MLVLQVPFGLAVLAKQGTSAGGSWHSGPDKVRVQVSDAGGHRHPELVHDCGDTASGHGPD